MTTCGWADRPHSDSSYLGVGDGSRPAMTFSGTAGGLQGRGLLQAAEAGADEVCRILLAQRADPNAGEGTSRRRPLLAAAGQGHAEVCELLLRKGACVSSGTSAGWTPLHAAAAAGHGRVCEVLLEKGADPYSKAQVGDHEETPGDTARRRGHGVCADSLEARARQRPIRP
ncbi:unnamed protein product [Polarella glacialis]|uniref:Uncharacterized protein n=1 Tax=Polarella glacialis TaxID=89957 RepID=A0A813H3Q9_POLGL|nr:unnamed protein product [Polarella glacialis]